METWTCGVPKAKKLDGVMEHYVGSYEIAWEQRNVYGQAICQDIAELGEFDRVRLSLPGAKYRLGTTKRYLIGLSAISNTRKWRLPPDFSFPFIMVFTRQLSAVVLSVPWHNVVALLD